VNAGGAERNVNPFAVKYNIRSIAFQTLIMTRGDLVDFCPSLSSETGFRFEPFHFSRHSPFQPLDVVPNSLRCSKVFLTSGKYSASWSTRLPTSSM